MSVKPLFYFNSMLSFTITIFLLTLQTICSPFSVFFFNECLPEYNTIFRMKITSNNVVLLYVLIYKLPLIKLNPFCCKAHFWVDKLWNLRHNGYQPLSSMESDLNLLPFLNIHQHFTLFSLLSNNFSEIFDISLMNWS